MTDDPLAIAGVRTLFDWTYLEDWAERLGVADLLTQAIRDAQTER